MFGGSLNGTQWPVKELAFQGVVGLTSSLTFTSLRGHSRKLLLVSLVVLVTPAEAWLSLVGSCHHCCLVFAIPTLLNCYIPEVFVSGSSCHC